MRFILKGSFMMAMEMAAKPAPMGGKIYFQFAPATKNKMLHTEASSMAVPKSGSLKINPNVTAMATPGMKRPYLNSCMRRACKSPHAAMAISKVILANSDG